jgi:hypothetical protein
MSQGIAEIELEVAWGPRQASLDDCAEASVRFLKRSASFFSGFQKIELTSTRKKQSVRLDSDCLAKVLQKGVNRTDVGHEVIPELGYSVGLTAVSSARPSYDVDVHLNLGVTEIMVPNEVRVELGAFDPVLPEQAAAIDWVGLLAMLVEVWSPLYGSLATRVLRDRPRLRRALTVGWLTYLSADQFPDLPPLPAPAAVRRINGTGNLIAIMPTAFPHHTRKDIALWNQVHRSLARLYLDVKSL